MYSLGKKLLEEEQKKKDVKAAESPVPVSPTAKSVEFTEKAILYEQTVKSILDKVGDVAATRLRLEQEEIAIQKAIQSISVNDLPALLQRFTDLSEKLDRLIEQNAEMSANAPIEAKILGKLDKIIP